MKKSKFTGGVWAQERPFSPKIVACYEDSYEHIATVEIPRREDMKAAKLEAAANARLIKAAPNLYLFAKYVLEMDPDSDSDAPLFTKARAVIAEVDVND